MAQSSLDYVSMLATWLRSVSKWSQLGLIMELDMLRHGIILVSCLSQLGIAMVSAARENCWHGEYVSN